MWPFRKPEINDLNIGKAFYSKFKDAPQQIMGVGEDEIVIIHPNGSRPATKADLWVDYVDESCDWGLNFAVDRDGRVETYGATTNLDYDRVLSTALR